MPRPVKPDATLTPNAVPLVLQPVDVVPVGSINTNGFVVVAEPPVKIVPVKVAADVDAAPFKEFVNVAIIVNWPAVVGAVVPKPRALNRRLSVVAPNV